MKLLSLVVAVLLVANGLGQVRPVYSAIESDAARANLICVGKITKIDDVRVDSFNAIELTIEVSETLKGHPQKTIMAQRFGTFGYDTKPYYEAAMAARTEFVWFTFSQEKARTEYSLDPASSPYRSVGGLAFGMDYTVLRTRKEVIERVRKFLKENPVAKGGEALLTPPPGQSLTAFVDFNIPLCPWAQDLAIRMITKPESFTFGPPTGNPYHPDSEPLWNKAKEGMLRTEGLILLRHFKSASNIALAKRYLNDGCIAIKDVYGTPSKTYYWVRDAAYRLLRFWDLDVEEPSIEGPGHSDQDGYFYTDGRRIEYMLRRS